MYSPVFNSRFKPVVWMDDGLPLEPHLDLALVYGVHAELREDRVTGTELLEAVGRRDDVPVADQGSAANVFQVLALLEFDAHNPGGVSKLDGLIRI